MVSPDKRLLVHSLNFKERYEHRHSDHKMHKDAYVTCPACLSNRVHLKNRGRRIGSAIGTVAGAAAGASAAISGAEAGAVIGLVAGPAGAAIGGLAGAIFGGYLALQQGALAARRSARPLTGPHWKIWTALTVDIRSARSSGSACSISRNARASAL